MKLARCPITYEPIPAGMTYSSTGLKKLSRQLTSLDNLPFSATELIFEAKERSDKMSIQGVQPKLSAVLSIKNGCFNLVSQGGRYILKPPSEFYPELPENEDLTMHMAECFEIETPMHGMVYNNDNSLTYFIKRFDRVGHNKKVAVEDFAQLSGLSRETKYNYSMEKIVNIIENYCTFPLIEKAELFKRVIFNYLVGNEDMHLKNYALITRNKIVTLAPAFDFLNSTIVIGNFSEEIALPINGKKQNLKRKDLVEYYAVSRLNLTTKTIQSTLDLAQSKLAELLTLLEKSFLNDAMKELYRNLLHKRYQVLFS